MSAADEVARERRRLERASYPVTVRRLGDADDEHEITPAEGIAMMWPLALDAWAFMGEPVVESRLPRHAVRVVRGER
ncbi:MAG: hypothetical protein U0527_16650 [Candidatus Eisenbacteria bacterium]